MKRKRNKLLSVNLMCMNSTCISHELTVKGNNISCFFLLVAYELNELKHNRCTFRQTLKSRIPKCGSVALYRQ